VRGRGRTERHQIGSGMLPPASDRTSCTHLPASMDCLVEPVFNDDGSTAEQRFLLEQNRAPLGIESRNGLFPPMARKSWTSDIADPSGPVPARRFGPMTPCCACDFAPTRAEDLEFSVSARFRRPKMAVLLQLRKHGLGHQRRGRCSTKFTRLRTVATRVSTHPRDRAPGSASIGKPRVRTFNFARAATCKKCDAR
jgi:hypothetical protein